MVKSVFVSLTAIMAWTAAHAEERRELGAHEHGHASLALAIEGDQIAVEIEAPGMDIVGFEHPASSDADKAAIDEGKSKLTDILTVLGVPEAAGCSVTSHNVALLGEDDHHDEDEHHADEEHHEGEEHTEHDEHESEEAHDEHAAHDDEHGDEASHTEFHATYALTCSDLPNGSTWDIAYFQIFENGEELEVSIVGDNGQASVELNREATQLDLSEVL